MNLHSLIEWTLITIAILVSVPTILLVIECLVGVYPDRCTRHTSAIPSNSLRRPTIDVIIPAHNEERGLRQTIASIQLQLKKDDRLCIVADNCVDATADVARALGAIVIERFDDQRRAKGYAIDAGLCSLDQEASEVTMIDADCIVAPDAINRLAYAAIASGKPIQAQYRMICSSSDDGWGAVSTFAVTVKNHVRPMGLHRLGFGCQLMGSGIAFPSPLARTVNWATGNIVEDMKISYELMLQDAAPQYCSEAVVLATLPDSLSDALQQRKRWEHGHLQTIATEVPKLFLKSLLKWRLGLLVAAIDLMIPPLSLLVQFYLFCSLAIAMATWCLGLSGIALVIVTASGTSLLLALICAWLVYGREQLPLRKLCTIPVYMISKIPLYASAVFRRQRSWIRTPRTVEEPSVCT